MKALASRGNYLHKDQVVQCVIYVVCWPPVTPGSSVLKFSDDSTFSASELSFIMLHV